MTIQLHTGKAELLFVKVPEGNTAWVLYNGVQRMANGGLSDMIVFNENVPGCFIARSSIPYAKWQIIGLADELTEEVWKELVETRIDGRWTFYRNYGDGHPWFDSVDSSVQSLFEANGLYWKNPVDPSKCEECLGTGCIKESHGTNSFEYANCRCVAEYEQAEQNTGPFLVLKQQ